LAVEKAADTACSRACEQKRRGSSLQHKAQTSGAFFPESHFPEITGVVVGVFLDFVECDRRRLPHCARHIFRRQGENERSGIGGTGAVDQAQLAADVARYIEQFKPLRHLTLRAAYAQYGSLIILLKGLTPIPYKIVTITSGFAGFNLPLFVVLSLITRGARFFVEAFLLNRYGARARGIIEKRLGLWAGLAALGVVIGFIVVVRVF
jgi:hypothetical protein